MTVAELHAHQADHRPYIEAVRAALLAEDLHVGVAHYTSGKVRAAAMTLLPPDTDFDEPWHPTFAAAAERVELHWNEEDGWSLLALHTVDGRCLPTIWRHGFGVVHPPATLCTWLALLLTMPVVCGSREDGPYRTHQTHDPVFEASLAAYEA